MQVASIIPTAYLHLDEDSDYFMVLPHTLESNIKYFEFFKEQGKRGKYLILDNGAAEGFKYSMPHLLELADKINVSEIVLPDVIKDKNATLEVAWEGFLASVCWTGKLMLVPQGKDLTEWIQCYDKMSLWYPIDTIGIPKWLSLDRPQARAEAAIYVNVTGGKRKVHFLGFNGDLEYVQLVNNWYPDFVRGIDSCYPWLCAKYEDPTMNRRLKGGIDFSDSSIHQRHVQHYMDTWRELFQ
jgi:hypothetical protein